jgi:hypothetical protein
MPIVRAKCTNCGANLSIDSLHDAAICQYCGTAFIVEKAINNYNVTNHIQANVVNIYANNARDFEIRGGVLTRYIGESMFANIPENVVEIGKGSFENSRIKRVIIPMGVVTISDKAFYRCQDLEQIEIPSSVKIIGPHAFSGCEKIESVIIPDSVKDLSCCAFECCGALKTVRLPDSLENLWFETFSCCGRLTTINLPKNIKRIQYECFAYCRSLKEIVLPPRVETIEKRAFEGCKALEKVNLPEGITQIGEYSFFKCESLEHIRLPITIKVIEHGAFANTNLTAISFPNKEVRVRWQAFDNCKNLRNVQAHRELEQLHDWKQAFEGTPYYDYLVIQERKRQNACLSCGSQDFTFFGKCKRCGEKKDY